MKKEHGAKSLQDLRQDLARIDEEILHSLKKRKDCVENIILEKSKKKIPLCHPDVEKQVCYRNLTIGNSLGLEASFILKLSKIFIDQSKEWQKNFIQEKL